jgi:hypothetical protein
MTESEWLAATDPQPMLEYLRGRASDRKLRLFACNAILRAWDVLYNDDPRCNSWCRQALERAEQLADGDASDGQVRAARLVVQGIPRGAGAALDPDNWPVEAALAATEAEAAEAARQTVRFLERVEEFAATQASIRSVGLGTVEGREGLSRFIEEVRARDPGSAWLTELVARLERWDAETAADPWSADAARVGRPVQVALLRELFGNPFCRVPPVDPAWLAYATGAVVRLARSAYDYREPSERSLEAGHLAVLADALEDAGCADPGLLGHLRGPGPHVRGCWALDLLLGKE